MGNAETPGGAEDVNAALYDAVAAVLAAVPASMSRWQQIGGVMVPVELLTELRRAAEAAGIGGEV